MLNLNRSWSIRPLVVGLASLVAAVGRGGEPPPPARLLVITVTLGYRHASIDTAEPVLEDLGRSTGLYRLDYLRMPAGRPEDPDRNDQLAGLFAKVFSAESLGQFDGVIFASTSGELPIPDMNGFLTWIKSGKAFIGFHAATDTLGKSDAYVDMVGGHFAGHPWNAGDEHAFVVHDPGHPVAAMFPPRFRWKDEIYQYDRRYEPRNLQVLVSLDMAASPPHEPRHVPVSWVRDYGKGRVFYTNLGHNEATWRERMFQEHARQGISWALGRTDAPALPNPQVQAAEHLRSVLAAASAMLAADHEVLRAKAEAKIAADPDWAVGLRPTLDELPGMGPDARRGAYAAVIAEVER